MKATTALLLALLPVCHGILNNNCKTYGRTNQQGNPLELGCAAGQFCSGGECVSCPAGHSSFMKSTMGPMSLSECIPCRKGEYGALNTDGTTPTMCTSCSGVPGGYGTSTGAEKCQTCGPNEYPESESCTDDENKVFSCLAGAPNKCTACVKSYVNVNFKTSPMESNCVTECVASEYVDGIVCKACAPGMYSKDKNLPSCTACPDGKYGQGGAGEATYADSQNCFLPSDGMTDSGDGKTYKPIDIASGAKAGACREGGTYCSGGQVKPCAPNTFSVTLLTIFDDPAKAVGITSCTACPEGEYSLAGAIECRSECPKGFAVKAGSGSGSGSDSQKGSCFMCDNNTFSSEINAPECTPCPTGYFSGFVDNSHVTDELGPDYSIAGGRDGRGVKGATTCSQCSGAARVWNGTGCSYCSAGETMFKEMSSSPFKSKYSKAKFFQPAAACLPCAPGTFSNESNVEGARADDLALGDGSSKFVRVGFATKHAADMQPGVNYQTARAVIQYMDYGAVDGGSCEKCPVGMVSAGYTPNKYSDARTGAGLLRVGATTCEWCPPGTYPDYDRAHCVNGGGIVALIVIVQLLFVFVDVVLWSPLNPKKEVDIGGAMRPTGAIFSVLWFIITIICVSAGNMSAPATAACAVIGFGGLFVIPCIFKSLESLASHDKDLDTVTNTPPSASDNAKTALPDAPPAYPEQVLNPSAHDVQ